MEKEIVKFCIIEVIWAEPIMGGPIQGVVSYRDQYAHKHTNMSLY